MAAYIHTEYRVFLGGLPLASWTLLTNVLLSVGPRDGPPPVLDSGRPRLTFCLFGCFLGWGFWQASETDFLAHFARNIPSFELCLPLQVRALNVTEPRGELGRESRLHAPPLLDRPVLTVHG